MAYEQKSIIYTLVKNDIQIPWETSYLVTYIKKNKYKHKALYIYLQLDLYFHNNSFAFCTSVGSLTEWQVTAKNVTVTATTYYYQAMALIL